MSLPHPGVGLAPGFEFNQRTCFLVLSSRAGGVHGVDNHGAGPVLLVPAYGGVVVRGITAAVSKRGMVLTHYYLLFPFQGFFFRAAHFALAYIF
jgi:hypothetical protein